MTPIFVNKDFEMMFRLSKRRVERIIQDIGNSGVDFFVNTIDAAGKQGASIEARVLLPLKTFAYGVPPHTFSDYFQMSKNMAKDCCRNFALVIKELYAAEYLRVPTSEDIRNITRLHQDKHGVPGMFGSLDCMHTPWKNCPKAWQGSYVSGQDSKKKAPSLVLEAVCDYHLWFWHASFGYAGSLNDLNILNLSPLLDSLVDGSFRDVELQSRSVPFAINGEVFDYLFMNVDGIYPPYARFTRTIHEPLTRVETLFAKWQEAVRKDIERAFGTLQGRWQATSRPFHQHDLGRIADVMNACLIMHNMCVSDRIMEGDLNARYNPARDVDVPELDEEETAYPNDFEAIGGAAAHVDIGLANVDPVVRENILRRQDHWQNLNDVLEHARLNRAIALHVAS
jgi:hypothetical protein